jgi:hemolysin activation/secretion protein
MIRTFGGLLFVLLLIFCDRSCAETPGEGATATRDVQTYVVDGNTVLDQTEIEQAVYPHLGPNISDAEIDAARGDLEKLYQSKGYQAVRVAVADQQDEDGAIHLTVTEVRVGRVRVVGSRYFSLREVKAEMPSLQEGEVPNFKDVQRDIQRVDALPERQVTPVPRPGKKPDTLDFDLVVKDEVPVTASVEINNQHAVSTAQLRAIGSLSYDNLWQLGHRLSLSFQTAPQNPGNSSVVSTSYLARFLGTPYGILLNGIVTNSQVASVGAGDVIGKGEIVGIRGTIDLPGSDDFSHSVQAGVDYKAFRNETATGIVPASYFPITASYHALLLEDHATDSADLALTLAPPHAGSNAAQVTANRANAIGQNLYFKATLERTQDLYAGFKGHVRLQGQLTDQPIISNEQLPLGGVNTVRGYFEGEKLADSGFNGTVEVISPSVLELAKAILPASVASSTLRVTAFLDGGRGYLHAPLPGQESELGLLSAGVAADATLFDKFSGSLALAVPLIATENTRAGAEQLLFRLYAEY